MVSPSKPNHSKVANKSTSYKCKLVKGAKPLINFKFYLDIENYSNSNKIENKIKELGGSIEFFLAKEVTHFITDKQISTDKNYSKLIVSSPKTPQTPQTPGATVSFDLKNISSPTHESKANTSKHRSRADAMLQRARLQNHDNIIQQYHCKKNSQSPVQIAKNFGTTIWSTEYTLKFLDKVFNDIKLLASTDFKNYNSAQHNHHHHHHSTSANHIKRSNHPRTLKGNYIKIESLVSKQYRPVYREFKNWPTINLNTSYCNSPFDSEITLSNNNKDMTRKNNRTKQLKSNNNNKTQSTTTNQKNNIATDQQCGYCEICRVEYDVLKVHVKSDEHVNFVKNDSNFLALDNLIKKTSNVDDFLKIKSRKNDNSKDKEIGFEKNVPVKQYGNKRLLRECEIKKEKLEVEDRILYQDDNSVMLHEDLDNNVIQSSRSKTRQSSNTNLMNCEFLDETRRSRRVSCRRINYAEPKEEDENTEDTIIGPDSVKSFITTPTKRFRGIRWRAPSPDTRPPSATPTLYKVESNKVVSNKKKPPSSEKQKENRIKSGDKIKIKLTRVRQSELSLLSNEAENFMFPKKELSESDDTDDDRQSTSDPAELSNEIISSETGVVTSNNHKISTTTDTKDQTKKRRNQLEAFLNDNTDYYKFENINSRLRFQEAPTQPTLEESIEDTKNISPEGRVGEPIELINKIQTTLNSDHVKRYKYSFERIPMNEPWFLAFQRQDEGKEKIFEYYGNTAYRKLPFEMGPLPPLSQNCSCLNQEHLKKSLSKLCSTPPSPLASTLNDDNTNDDSNSKLNSISELNSNLNYSNNKKNNAPYISKKKMALLDACHPRKSPREHASTLAILSSIVQTNEPKRKRNKDSISSNESVTVKNDDQSVTFNDENSMSSIIIDDQPIIESNKIEIHSTASPSPSINDNDDNLSTIDENIEIPTADVFPPALPTAVPYQTSNSLCREIDKFLTVTYNVANIENIPKTVSKKNDDNLLITKDSSFFVDVIKSINLSEFNIETDFRITQIKQEIINKRLANHKLSKAESLHLARMSRKRKYNRTGWPIKKRYIPNSMLASSSSSNVNNLNNFTNCKIENVKDIETEQQPSTTNDLNSRFSSTKNGKQLFLNSCQKMNADMFTISSSDSLDSALSSQFKLVDNKDELDSVSTRSVFISDDSSIGEDDSNFVSSHSSNKTQTFIPSNFNNNHQSSTFNNITTTVTSTIKQKVEEQKLKTEEAVTPTPVKTTNNSKSSSNTKNGLFMNKNIKLSCSSNLSIKLNRIKPNDKTCFFMKNDDDIKSYGLRSSNIKTKKKGNIKKKKPLRVSPKITKSPSTIIQKHKQSSPSPTIQFSPRKLRKPRGRWYRER